MMRYDKLGERLRNLRKEHGISTLKAANEIGISVASLNYYEQGVRNPGASMLSKIADFYNVSVDYLLGRTSLKNVCKDESALIEDVEKLQSEIKKRSDALQQALGDARLYAEGGIMDRVCWRTHYEKREKKPVEDPLIPKDAGDRDYSGLLDE